MSRQRGAVGCGSGQCAGVTARYDLPPMLRETAFAVHEALDLGVGPRRLEASDLRRPFHGVRVPAAFGSTLFERCVALSTRFRDGDAFAGATAAQLWGMPVPAGLAHGPLFVSSRPPLHPMRRRGVVGSMRSHDAVVVFQGLPALNPADAWIDLAGLVDLDDAVAAADWLVTPRRERPALSTVTELEAAVEVARRRPGAFEARRALPWVRVGAWSPRETLLRLLLVRTGIPEPELNRPITPAIVPDLAWPEYRVCAEYNGDYHDDEEQRPRDLRRAEAKERLGWSTVNVDRHDLPTAPVRVAARLRERGWPGTLTSLAEIS